MTVKTDQGDIRLINGEVKQFIADCLPVDTTSIVHAHESKKQQDASMAMIQNQHLEIVDMRQKLLESIDKIDQNADYIPQAKAINNAINSVLNMTKLEFQIAKELKKAQ